MRYYFGKNNSLIIKLKEVFMLASIKKYKIVVIVVIVDLVLTWLVVFSGICLPLINPSIEHYAASGTSFPRDYTQKLIWMVLHAPISVIIDLKLGGILKDNVFVFLGVLQTGLIASYVNKKILK